jgi:hypothetical protein
MKKFDFSIGIITLNNASRKNVIIANPLRINTFLLKSDTGGSNGKKNNKNIKSPVIIPRNDFKLNFKSLLNGYGLLK